MYIHSSANTVSKQGWIKEIKTRQGRGKNEYGKWIYLESDNVIMEDIMEE